MLKQNKLILLLLICSLLPTQAHAGWRETALKIFSGGKTAATSIAEEQLPVQTAAARSAVAQVTTTAIPSTVTSAALKPLHLQLPPMPTTSDLSVAYDATVKRAQQLQKAGQLPTGMPPTMAAAAITEYNLKRAITAAPEGYKDPLLVNLPLVATPFTYKTSQNALRTKDIYPDEQTLFDNVMGKIIPPLQRHRLARKIADRQNVIYTHYITEVAPAIRRQINELRPQFEQIAAKWASHQPENPVIWAAQQVPENTDNLMIGELHTEYIPQQLLPMLDVLIEKMKGREIIFLTEFLPKGHVLDLEHDIAAYSSREFTHQPRNFPLWTALTERNIPIIGLEPNFVAGTVENENARKACEFYTTLQGKPCNATVERLSTSLEGLRIRNKFWLEEIRKQRAAHPNALFIIHAGAGHTNMGDSFSIAREAEGNNFVMEIYASGTSDSFDLLVAPTQMPDCFALPNPQLARAAGFNLRIKLGESK